MAARTWVRWALSGALVLGGCAVGAGSIGDDDAASSSDATTTDGGGGNDASQCNGQPTDLKSDKQNCGTCGHACPPTASCTFGSCQCPSSQSVCNGACVDLGSDLQNCGKCSSVCQSTGDAGLQGGGTWQCEAGLCEVACTGGLTSCVDGCYDVTKNVDHCGNCSTSCGKGSCCSSNCVDTTSDDANCGACGTACTTSQACSSGHCCASALTWCTSACTNTLTDTKNCGACGTACTSGQTCVGGKCCSSPPQGTCAHSLCDSSSGTSLKSGCDTGGCVKKVCTADSFCCATDWDSICVSEVATYCSPYSCSGC